MSVNFEINQNAIREPRLMGNLLTFSCLWNRANGGAWDNKLSLIRLILTTSNSSRPRWINRMSWIAESAGRQCIIQRDPKTERGFKTNKFWAKITWQVDRRNSFYLFRCGCLFRFGRFCVHCNYVAVSTRVLSQLTAYALVVATHKSNEWTKDEVKGKCRRNCTHP